MAAVTATILAIAAVGSLGVAAYSAVEQRKQMKKEEANYKKDSKKAEDQMKAQQKEESMSEFKADKVARQRQITRGRSNQDGRSGTILTNPVSANPANTQAKTLLGS